MTSALAFSYLLETLRAVEALFLQAGVSAKVGSSRGLSIRPLDRLDRGDLCSEVALRVARHNGCSVESIGPEIAAALNQHKLGEEAEFFFERGYVNIRLRENPGSGVLPSLDFTGLGQPVLDQAPEVVVVVPPKHKPASLRLAARALVQRGCLTSFGQSNSLFLGTQEVSNPTLVGLWEALQSPRQVIWQELCDMLTDLKGRRALVWLGPQEYPERAFRKMVAQFPNVIFRAPSQRWLEELRDEDFKSLACGAQNQAEIALLASSLEGAGLDIRVARCGEGWNLPWFYRSLLARAEKITGNLELQGGTLGVVPTTDRALWHSYTFLPLFRAWAAVQGDVGEYLDVLMRGAYLCNTFLNKPARRIAWASGQKNPVELQILAGVTQALRDTIKTEPAL